MLVSWYNLKEQIQEPRELKWKRDVRGNWVVEMVVYRYTYVDTPQYT
jgi:hypothetical protein